jgi:hypothetical protein
MPLDELLLALQGKQNSESQSILSHLATSDDLST